jgi:hypothetical protein
MKKALAALCLLLMPSFAFAGDKKAPNPADYPLTAHVVLSRATLPPNVGVQTIEAVIDGKEVVLEGGSFGVLALGDYKARISEGSYSSTKPNAYDTYIKYELLFPDGHTRSYQLIGLGFGGEAAAAKP